MYDKTRGLRNNNPGNIRLGEHWQGMTPTQTDSAFVQFESPEYGVRAMARILYSYQRRGLLSVRDIISTWAPPNENNTDAYIADVAHSMNVAADQELNFNTQLPTLIAAIIKHENGIQPYSMATIEQGIALA